LVPDPEDDAGQDPTRWRRVGWISYSTLYQNKKRVPFQFNLYVPNDVIDLLYYFFTCVEPDIENFEQAVDEFKAFRKPDLFLIKEK
jgi:hypothetical protein